MTNCSIILIAYYGDPWLPTCLKSLITASRTKLHLIIGDNFGNGELSEVYHSHFETEVINLAGPQGFAIANNNTLVSCSRLGDYVLFLNQDTISTASWIDHCIALLESDKELGAVSPLIRTYDGSTWDPSFLDCLSTEQRQSLDKVNMFPVMYTEHAPAPALIIRKSVLGSVGPFDPIYGSYYEDYDLCERIRAAGYKVGFCCTALIQHYSGSSTSTRERELKRMQQIIRNRSIYQIRYGRNSRIRKIAKLFTVDLILRLGRSIFKTPSSQPLGPILYAYTDLVKLLPRLLLRAKDESYFRRYLDHLGWNKVNQ